MNMRITTAQMAQLFTQTMQGAKEANSVELKVGTVVQATLLEVMKSDAQALIQVGASKMMAKLDADLQAGDQVSLLVTGGQKNGALELKVVSLQNASDSVRTLDLSNLLKAVGLPDQAGNKALVNEWLARQLPLQSDVLLAASDVLRQWPPGPTPTAVSTLGKMAELGIPIHLSTFEAMNALDNGPQMHDLLGNVLTQLQALLPETDTGQGNLPLVPGTAQQAGQAQQAWQAAQSGITASNSNTAASPNGTQMPSNAGFATESGSAETAAGSNASADPFWSQSNLPPAPEQTQAGGAVNGNAPAQGSAPDSLFLGIKISRQPAPTFAVAQNAPEQATGIASSSASAQAANAQAANSSAQPNALSSHTQQTLANLSQVVRDLLSDTGLSAQELADKSHWLGLGFEEKLAQAIRRLPADSTTAQVKDALVAAAQSADDKGADLKQLLLSTQIAGKELDAAGLQPLHQDLSTLLQQVTGQQLMQSQVGQRSDLFYQFTAVPMQIGGQQQTLELHVMSRKSPGQKKLDPANCYVLFHLNMPRLGELDIHLHIVDKVVGLRFLTNETQQVTLPLEDQKELRTALQAVGFHLGAVKVEEHKQAVEGFREPLLPPILTQGTLDVKA